MKSKKIKNEKQITNHGYTNKKAHLTETRAIPESCPQCNNKSNFRYWKEYPKSNFKIIDISMIQCPKCKWIKDITPYDLI